MSASIAAPAADYQPADADPRFAAQRLFSLSTYLQECGEAEKAALAHKLHDDLGGLLTAAKMDLSWIQSRLDPQNPLISRFAQLGAVLDEAMDLKRQLVEELRPSLLEHFGFATAVRAHVEQICAKHQLRFEVTIEEENGPRLSRSASIALFRVIQAGLDNIVAHASAKFVRLEIDSRHGALDVTLSDDGVGLEPDRLRDADSMGIAGMRHRVLAMGGTINFRPTEGGGTTIQVRIQPSAPS